MAEIMGDNMEAVIEITDKNSDKHPEWDCWAHLPWFHRWYRVFACVAGVRQSTNPDIVPVSPPKGFPFGISDVVRTEAGVSGSFPNGDGFAASWLSVDEVRLACERLLPDKTELDAVLAAMIHLQEIHDDVRFVFWFD